MCCVLCWSVQLIGKYCLSIHTSRKNGCQSKLPGDKHSLIFLFSFRGVLYTVVCSFPHRMADVSLCWSILRNIQARCSGRRWKPNRWKDALMFPGVPFLSSFTESHPLFVGTLTETGQKAEEACHCCVLRDVTVNPGEKRRWVLGIKSPYMVKTESASVCCWWWRTSPNTTSVSTTLSAPQKGFLPSTFWIKFRSHCFLRLWCPLMCCEIRWIWKYCWSSPLVCVTEPNNCNRCHSSPACGAD